MGLQGRYTIIRKIADGGMAEVFLAKQHGLQGFQKNVALKRIRTAYYADPQFRDMLIDEAHIAMSLNHSNIVQVLDIGDVGGRYFLALELVDGWTVEQIQARARVGGLHWPPELALYLTVQVCRALAYAHGMAVGGKPLGIVHRDVSTHNVLVSEEGEVKLTDFGIAKALNRREQTAGDVVKGKISFMSPEQAAGQPLDLRSDLFSLGVMLYSMAVGRRPFDAPTDLETLALIKAAQSPPPMRPGLNPQVSRIIMRAMRKVPAERYQRAEEMMLDVERVMRVGFRAVGQTELKQWLADLGRVDGTPTITAAAIRDASSGEEIGAALVAGGDSAASEGGASAGGPSSAAPQSGWSLDWGLARIRSLSPGVALLVGGTTALAAAVLALTVAFLAGGRPEAPPAATRASLPPVSSPPSAPLPPQDAAHAASPPPVAPREAVAAPPTAGPVPTAERAPAESAAGPDDGADPVGTRAGAAPEAEIVSVAITSTPEGATVRSRQRVLGTTPVSARLKAGHSYEISFSKPGYQAITSKLRTTADKRQRLSVALRPDPRRAAAPAKKKRWYWPFD